MKHQVQKAGSVVLDIKRYFHLSAGINERHFFFFAHPDVENGQWNNKQHANE